jgi:hypothetical protein
MTTLQNRSPKDSFKELLKINSQGRGFGLDSTLRTVEGGDATASPLQLATDKIAFHGKQWPTTGGSTPGSILQVSSDATKLEWVTKVNSPQLTTSFFPGLISSSIGTIRWYPGKSVTLQSVFMAITTAPSSQLVIDVKKSGVSIFGAGAKPTIAATSNTSTIIPLSVSMASNEYLTIDILSGNGSDLMVRFEYQ